MNNTKPFGGKLIVLTGDFRQTLPIVPRGSRCQAVDAALNHSFLWKHFQIYRLCENMRVHLAQQSMELKDPTRMQKFSDWLITVGDGSVQCCHDDYIELPNEMCVPPEADGSPNIPALLEWVFPDLNERCKHPVQAAKWLASRAVLAPTNAVVDELNSKMLKKFNGREIICCSADKLTGDFACQNTNIQEEYLNAENPAGMPAHRFIFKRTFLVPSLLIHCFENTINMIISLRYAVLLKIVSKLMSIFLHVDSSTHAPDSSTKSKQS
jgi:hypothetical protein